MAVSTESTSSPSALGPLDDVTPCCYFLRCSNRVNDLPGEFSDLLKLHNKSSITVTQGSKSWKLEVDQATFGKGWTQFISDNQVTRRSQMLLRHNGNLSFDLILFTELQISAYFPWTVPLSDVLKQRLLQSSADKKAKYILHQHACSSIKPDIVHNLSDSIAFYHIYNEENKNHLKLPKSVACFLNGNKTPIVTLRTGYQAFQVRIDADQFTTYWQRFVCAHQLDVGESLVFIPEDINSFTVQIYRPDGIEKLFPWYHKYYVLSYL